MEFPRPVPPVEDENRGSVLLIIQILTFVIAFSLTCTRIWTRTKIVGTLGWDDFLVTIGMIIATATIAPFVKSLQAGMGRHIYYLNAEQLVEITLWGFIAQYLVTVSTLFIRLSVATFLIRIFGVNKRWRRGLMLVVIFIVVSNILTLVFALMECHPIQKSWDPTIGGTCWSPAQRKAFVTYQGSVGISSDWGLALLPIVCLWKSQLRPLKKFLVCSLMGMGIFTGVCPLVRMRLTENFKSPDVSWFLLDQSIWAVLEMNFGLIASCIPTLKPLLQHLTKVIKTWRSRPNPSYATWNSSAQRSGTRAATRAHSDTTHEGYLLADGLDVAPRAVKPLPSIHVDESAMSKQASPSSLV